MKFKYVLMASLILTGLMVGAVCAADTISEDVISGEEEISLEIADNDLILTGESSFSNLADEIESAGESLDLNQDYAFNNATDNKNGILIGKDNFAINGNGHTIDGNNQSKIFNITGNNVTLSNLILINGNSIFGGAISSTGILTLNNVTFINNYASEYGGAVDNHVNATLNCYNSRFIDNYASAGSSINLENVNLNLYNTEFTSKEHAKYSQIVLENSTCYVENSSFTNIVSDYAPAIYIEMPKALTVIGSRFINLTANISAGAIGTKEGGEIYIRNCEFVNTTSAKNAGAIITDIAGRSGQKGNVIILDTIFKDTFSEFGGAYIQLGGNLLINNSEFINNHATYNGGSVYISYVTSGEINNCNFTSNGVGIIEDYPTYGGAIFCDMSTLTVNDSNFINNTASAGNAICAYDTSYNIKNSLFENNTNPIYTFFDKNSILENNVYINDDNVSTNNTLHEAYMVGEGLQLTLINNTINVDTLPSRFDLRDWNWVTPVRNQGWMGSCWAFGMTGALESALLKATGINGDLSENNMQNSMLKYSIYGGPVVEGGVNILSSAYLLSWLGAFIQDADTYDEVGKISPLITTTQDIHIQDIMFTPNREIPNSTQLKEAIMKYGAIDGSYNGQSTYNDETPYYNPSTYSQYVNVKLPPNHSVSIVGWDDNFPKEKFGITPPGDGAWIVKNSWDTDWGDNGYLYVSYYDKSFLVSNNIMNYASSIIIENTVPYNKNYQYAIFWADFLPGNGNVSYCNLFEALDDDLIAGVGTYFNQSGINYKVEIFVNDVLKLTQEGISPYLGYHTIKLNNYIPIKMGDIFNAVITSNCIPIVNLTDTRMHYTENISFESFDGQTWQDSHKSGHISCLKVYTVADDSEIINNKDISVDYDAGKYFSVKVLTADGHAVAGANVKFTINKKTTTVKTNSNGIAKIKITDVPKKYTITTKYKGKTYKNTVTVKQVLKTAKVTVKKTAKKFTLKATLKINGKLVKGKTITFNFKGKNYKVKTNSKGIAQKTLNKNVIKKLQKGKTYNVKVTYLKDTIKTTLKVK